MIAIMKYFTFVILSFFCIMNIASVYAQPVFGPARLQLTTQNWPPYQDYVDEEMRGLAIDKVKCALNKMGQPYQITMTAWSDAQLRVQSGLQHGFFVATQTAERETNMPPFQQPLPSKNYVGISAPGLSQTSTS